MRARSRLKTENIPPRTITINVFGRYVTGNAPGRKTMLLCADDFFVANVTQLYARVTRAGITAVQFNDGVPRSFRLLYIF